MLKWDKVGISNVAGEVALASGLVMWGTSFPAIRRKIFELFFYTHYLYVVFVVFFVLHVGWSYSCIMLPGFYLFLIDRYLRFLQSQRKIQVVSARLLPCQAVELNFAKCPGEEMRNKINVTSSCNKILTPIEHKFANLISRLELFSKKHCFCKCTWNFQAAMASFYSYF